MRRDLRPGAPGPHGQILGHHGLRWHLPLRPGKRYEGWPVDDPAVDDPDQVQAIRDEVDSRVRELLASLLPGLTLPAR